MAEPVSSSSYHSEPMLCHSAGVARVRGRTLKKEGNVTIPPLDPSARDEEEPDYDEEAQVWAAAMEHAAEVDEETPDEYDWQISRLVSAATYTAGPDAGRVSTGRMKVTCLVM